MLAVVEHNAKNTCVLQEMSYTVTGDSVTGSESMQIDFTGEINLQKTCHVQEILLVVNKVPFVLAVACSQEDFVCPSNSKQCVTPDKMCNGKLWPHIYVTRMSLNTMRTQWKAPRAVLKTIAILRVPLWCNVCIT